MRLNDRIFPMEARIINEGQRDEWNDFVSASPECPILQSYEWGELKSYSGWKPIRLALFDGDNIVAAASILKRRLPYTSKSIFYLPRGPVLDFKKTDSLDILLEAVQKEAKRENAILIKIDPFVLEDDQKSIENLSSRGFARKKKQIQPRVTFLLDLTKDLPDILASFEEKTRYNVRLSEKKGVEVWDASDEGGVELFSKMYGETAQRDNFLIHPKSYYDHVKELIIDRGMGKIFVANYQGKPIASVIIFTFGHKAWYMYGASISKYRNVMPNHALHWHVIKWAREKGIKTYDLWGIPANPTEKHPLWGVYRFKKGFNGKLVKLIGVYDKPLSPLYYQLFDKGLAFLQSARSLITKGKISDSLGE